MTSRKIPILVVVFTALALLGSTGEASMRVGSAIRDITGPAAERGMMGYANPSQRTQGIHTRLRSRAFVFEDASGAHVAFVSADLGMIPEALKLAVVRELSERLPGIFTDENLMITATHTHSGPGGYSHDPLVNITTLGFDAKGFETIVSGITDSIVRAWNQREPGLVRAASGEARDIAINRSPEAYLQNPESRGELVARTNPTMTLLRLDTLAGEPLGLVDWYSVHATSMSQRNKLISSDNKGHASLLFERWMGAGSPGPGRFVAAFANSDEGDSSPNLFVPDRDELWKTAEIGRRQFEAAAGLFASAREELAPRVEFRHAWVRMEDYVVHREFTGASPRKLCVAAIGYSFAAGAEDGRSGLPYFHEGMRADHPFDFKMLAELALGFLKLPLTPRNPTEPECQFPKPILLPVGSYSPPWTPEILPFQIFILGDLAIAGVPGEMTTIAGARLRQTVLERFAPRGVKRAVIAGLANSYSGYITTREEYQMQHYEGAFTLFGPDTLAAYQQIFASMADQEETGVGVAPELSQKSPPDFQPGVVYDDKRIWEKWGQVKSQPAESYPRGSPVVAVFRAGHPKNDYRLENGYLEVQREVDGEWVTVAHDWDPETIFRWRRDKSPDCLACSFAEIRWDIPADAPSGRYRIRHHGAYKSLAGGKIKPYSGTTRVFEVSR